MNDPKRCPMCGAQNRQMLFVEDGARVDIMRCPDCRWEEYTDDLDWSPAPAEGYIALSDSELKAAEAEDREFQTCHTCGQLSEDCQCEVDE